MAGLPLTDHEVALLWPDATEADLESEFERDAAREERRIMRSPIARRLSAFVQGDDWMKGEHNEESLQFLGNKQPWKEDT